MTADQISQRARQEADLLKGERFIETEEAIPDVRIIFYCLHA